MPQSNVFPEPLSGKYENSFAFKTLSLRLPVILTKVIDYICRNRKVLPVKLLVCESDRAAAEEETKSLIEELAKLKYELQTNKSLTVLKSDLPDVRLWNDLLLDESLRNKEVTFFNVSWLYSECFVYRKLREILYLSKYYKSFDPFEHNKQETFINSKKETLNLSTNLNLVEKISLQSKSVQELFHDFIMASLYGNKCDLSISCGDTKNKGNLEFSSLDSKIISNNFLDLSKYVDTLSKTKNSFRLDIVLDNAGYELFTDLVLAEFFHRSNLFPKEKTIVYLHVKRIPWFVSDAMIKDIHWLLEEIDANKDFVEVRKCNADFKKNIKNKTWLIVEHDFWTSPYDFSQMSTLAPDLYSQLSKSDLIIFKGDLNYRKLVGDLNWSFTTTFKDSLREFKPPTAICSLRTIKADVVVGISDQKVLQQIKNEFPATWMETGDYATIQFVDNHL